MVLTNTAHRVSILLTFFLLTSEQKLFSKVHSSDNNMSHKYESQTIQKKFTNPNEIQYQQLSVNSATGI